MKILLILPEWRLTTSRWSLNSHPYISKKAFIPPISMATIAAITPVEYETEIWDESVHGLIDEDTEFDADYDIVGVGGYFTSFFRAKALAELLRSRGKFLVAGGAGVTAAPDDYADYFDVLVLGEAEAIWPQFLNDYKNNDYKKIYKDKESVDMSLSPKPKWGRTKPLMKGSYAVGAIQTTRGCPFMCEFCNVWKVFGRKMRTKHEQQVVDEILELESAGMKHISFCEDNFYGNPKYAKAILRELIKINETREEPLHYYAEISINIVWDEDVLKMLADAGFAGLFIGVESPSRESLKETKKVQNLKGDLVDNCLKIQSYGLPIEASMIVGFDHDDESIFDLQFEFLQKACIPYPRIRMLQARSGTDTFDKMVVQNRVLDVTKLHDKSSYFDSYLISNIIPELMTRKQLFENYLKLVEKIYDWDNFTERMVGYIELVRYRPVLRIQSPTDKKEVPEDLKNFISFLNPKERECVIKILTLTAQKIPEQLYNVVTLIVRQQLEAQNLEMTRKTIMEQIEFESHIDLNDCILYQQPANVMVA